MNRKANVGKWVIYFDLDTKALSLIFRDYRQAYKQIEKYMIDNGFEHIQYSSYETRNEWKETELLIFSQTMFEKFDWLLSCSKSVRTALLKENYDLVKSFLEYQNEFLEQDMYVEEEMEL